MGRGFDATAPVPHRLLPFDADRVRIELTAVRMVKQEPGIPKGLECSFLDEPMLVEATKKGSANYHRVGGIALGQFVEYCDVLSPGFSPTIKHHRDAREPDALDFMLLPLMPLCIAHAIARPSPFKPGRRFPGFWPTQ